MKNEPNKIRVSYFLVLAFSILYFLFLKKYYFISYEIPDYFFYITILESAASPLGMDFPHCLY